MIKMKIHRRAFIFRSDGNAIFENIPFRILLLALLIHYSNIFNVCKMTYKVL